MEWDKDVRAFPAGREPGGYLHAAVVHSHLRGRLATWGREAAGDQGRWNEVGIVAPRKAKADLKEAVPRQPFVHFLDTLVFLKTKQTNNKQQPQVQFKNENSFGL